MIGHIYAVLNPVSGNVKLGRSIDVAARLREIQIHSDTPLKLLTSVAAPDAHAVEQALHAHYTAYRKNGEWFALPQDELAKLPTVMLAFARETPVRPPKAIVTGIRAKLAQLLHDITEQDSRSLAQIARDLGMTRQWLHQLRTGAKSAAPEAIEAACNSLGYSIEVQAVKDKEND